MTDNVQKILSEIATRKLCTMDEHMAFYNDKAKEDYRFLSEIEEIIRALQEEPVTSVWHDSNTLPVAPDKNHLWVVVSFKNGDIRTCFIDTLVTWQRVQREAIDCWAYREDLLKL